MDVRPITRDFGLCPMRNNTMKAPIITTLAGLAAMFAGYFAGAYFGSQEAWMLMFVSYLIDGLGAGAFLYGLIWGIYEMLWGGRWKP